MGILDNIAGFGNSFADTYFGIGAKQNTERKAEQEIIGDFEKNRGATRTNDYGDLLFEAQQQYPEFFDQLAGQQAETARNVRNTQGRAADFVDIHNDPEFLNATEGIDPSSPEYASAVAKYLGGRGFAGEASAAGSAANAGTAAERKLFSQMMALASEDSSLVDPAMLRKLAIRAGFNPDVADKGDGAAFADSALYGDAGDPFTGAPGVSTRAARTMLGAFDTSSQILKGDAAAQKANQTAAQILGKYIDANGKIDVQKLRGDIALQVAKTRAGATVGAAQARAGGRGGAQSSDLFGSLDVNKIANASPELASIVAQAAVARINMKRAAGEEFQLNPVDMVYLQYLAKRGGITDLPALLKSGGAPAGGRNNIFAPANPGSGGQGRGASAPSFPGVNSLPQPTPSFPGVNSLPQPTPSSGYNGDVSTGGPLTPQNSPETPGLTLEEMYAAMYGSNGL